MEQRIIKFRGIDPKTNEFIYGQLAYFFDNLESPCIMPKNYFITRDFGGEDEKGNIIIEEEAALGGFINVKLETVGQFTGLLDKNGKEIYEGDILRHEFYNHSSPNVTFIQQVYFDNGCFSCKTIGKETDLEFSRHNVPLYYSLPPNVIEVIGNIHQNPELAMKQVLPHIFVIEVPKEAYDFEINIDDELLPIVVMLDYKITPNKTFPNGVPQFEYLGGQKFELLGTITPTEIDFDCEDIEELWFNNLYKDFLNPESDLGFTSAEQSFRSALTKSGIKEYEKLVVLTNNLK